MDVALLRSWLALPPGPWPPDHYALLGLDRDATDPAAIEAVVLAKMDHLRSHQLRHPDLVTEGMNRLAQALVCLTDPAARATYDAGLGPSPPRPPQPLEVPFVPGLGPPEPGPPADTLPVRPAYVLVPDERPAYVVVPDDPPAAPEPEPLPLPRAARRPRTRRELFARLALLRRVRAAWHTLRPVLADPGEPLNRPAAVLALLEAVADLQPLLRRYGDDLPEGAGALVSVLVRQRFVLPTFRTLLPDQRRALSLDWSRGELFLRGEHDRLRELVRAGRPLRGRDRRGARLVRWAVRTPELVPVVLAVAWVVVALLRARGGQ
ncbi:unnamed protein product [Gemmataceae bacterium]|nr:unnamed protein product [Gemmataceae bacterium]VTU01910.1 unnamed protein product [Gemmataceae bacterium]